MCSSPCNHVIPSDSGRTRSQSRLLCDRGNLSAWSLPQLAKRRFIQVTDRSRNEMTVVESDNWIDFDTARITLFIATPKFLQFPIDISSASQHFCFRQRLGCITRSWYNISRKKIPDQFAWHLVFQILSLLPLRLSFRDGIVVNPIIMIILNWNVYSNSRFYFI